MSAIAPTSSGSQYTDEQRRQAIVEYAVQGSIPQTAKNVGIPERTLYDWKKKDWWEDSVAEIREQNKDLIDAQLEQLAIKGFQAMAERIEHGDAYIGKEIQKDAETGAEKLVEVVKYKPVSLRDLSTASGIAYDKMRLHRNQPTSIKAESTDDRLNSLAEKVRELQGGMVTIEGEVTKTD